MTIWSFMDILPISTSKSTLNSVFCEKSKDFLGGTRPDWDNRIENGLFSLKSRVAGLEKRSGTARLSQTQKFIR
jgi:hypothetical protein